MVKPYPKVQFIGNNEEGRIDASISLNIGMYLVDYHKNRTFSSINGKATFSFTVMALLNSVRGYALGFEITDVV